jgi:predicted nucleic acid-binding protein
MTSYFADTSLFVAFLNPRDEYHELAVEFVREESNRLVTTIWVLVELGNFVSRTRTRRRFVPFVRDLRDDPFVEIVPPMLDQFDQALDLYHRRPDKHWSMTDCTSFLVMRERGLTDAPTTDHHFEQAGFRILLK